MTTNLELFLLGLILRLGKLLAVHLLSTQAMIRIFLARRRVEKQREKMMLPYVYKIQAAAREWLARRHAQREEEQRERDAEEKDDGAGGGPS